MTKSLTASMIPQAGLGDRWVSDGAASPGAGVRIAADVTVPAGVVIEDDVVIGVGVIFEEGACRARIGRGARIGGNATLGAGIDIGANSVIRAGAVVAWPVPPNAIVRGNPAAIEGYVDTPVLAVAVERAEPCAGARSIVLPGVTIGRDALVDAGTLVTRDIPAEAFCLGASGRLQGSIRVLRQRGSILPADPWRRHFHRGYPPEIVAQWRFEFPKG